MDDTIPLILNPIQRRSISKALRTKAYKDFVYYIFQSTVSEPNAFYSAFNDTALFILLEKYDDVKLYCNLGSVDSLWGAVFEFGEIEGEIRSLDPGGFFLDSFPSTLFGTPEPNREVYHELGYLTLINHFMLDEEFESLRQESPEYVKILKEFVHNRLRSFVASDTPDVIKSCWLELNLKQLSKHLDRSIDYSLLDGLVELSTEENTEAEDYCLPSGRLPELSDAISKLIDDVMGL